MYSAANENAIVVRLIAGEEVIPALLKAMTDHGVEAGFVTSGIGMLADPEFGYFVSKGKYASRTFDGRFECLCLTGNISRKDGELTAHIHGMCADEDYHVFGGHLFQATVGLTLEVMISRVKSPVKMHRELEEETGLAGLLVE